MYLLIDPSEKDTIKIVGFTENRIETEMYPAANREILASVDSFLSTRGLDKKDVQGIAVVVGAGGFTSTRIATTVANVWHFVYKIQVFGVSREESLAPQALIVRFKNPRATGTYILAQYSGEPNIGTK